jgi:hypothetical protein
MAIPASPSFKVNSLKEHFHARLAQGSYGIYSLALLQIQQFADCRQFSRPFKVVIDPN